ncbi:MAG: 4Fe-4S dicluster domain-containing protein [Dehalococcoidales bacterium]|nr:4Fe-4S dicluster domain-containing protein [Dehalococcoidales bacterium]
MTTNNPLIIDKKKLAGLLDELLKEYRIIAPVQRNGIVVFEEVHSGKDVLLEFSNSKMSPKGLFFPQSDVLFSYESSGKETKLQESVPDTRKTVIFGMRPCDAKAVLILDKVFLQNGREDSNYKRRRDNTIILAVGCTDPRSTCFCTSMNGGPFSMEGTDALFTDIGGSFAVEANTAKGKELLGRHLSVEADDEALKQLGDVKQKAVGLIQCKVDAKRASELDLLQVFKSTYWDRVHEKCVGCGVCTYMCPTCSCFDVVDENNGAAGERIRIWDPCMFPLYTLQASGFNPRPTGKERMRQRILHKLNYATGGHGGLTCVGCGRCVSNCPVNLDIRQVINSLAGGEG